MQPKFHVYSFDGMRILSTHNAYHTAGKAYLRQRRKAAKPDRIGVVMEFPRNYLGFYDCGKITARCVAATVSLNERLTKKRQLASHLA